MGQTLASLLPEPRQWRVDESVIASMPSMAQVDESLPVWNQTGYASVASGPLPSEIYAYDSVPAAGTGT